MPAAITDRLSHRRWKPLAQQQRQRQAGLSVLQPSLQQLRLARRRE
jgi:hypothetical protein